MSAAPSEATDEEGPSTGPTPAELVAFVLSAPKRRRRVALAAALLAGAGGISVALVKPVAYVSEVKISAQRGGTVRDLAAPRQIRDESPSKGAYEEILRRDNLIGLLDDSHLMDRWEAERPLVLRLKDKVMTAIRGPIKEEDQKRGMVGLLEKKILVSTDETSVTITAEWTNAKDAYLLASLAEKRFLDGRHSVEIGMISDAIEILETHIGSERERLNGAVEELQRLEEQKHHGELAGADALDAGAPDAAAPDAGASDAGAPAVSHPRPRVALRPVAPVAGPSPELKRLVEDKKREVATAEAARDRHLNELNTQLVDLRTTLAPAHPSITALQRKIEAVSAPSPEIAALKAEARQLEGQLNEATAAAEGSVHAGSGSLAAAPEAHASNTPDGGSPMVIVQERGDDDAATALAKKTLENASRKSDDLTSRLRAARIELDVAQAAFKYKYGIITPAEVPRDPKKPAPSLIAAAGVLFGGLLYFLVPAIVDLLCGRLIVAWQARKLGIPLLGEVDAPDA